LSSVQVYFIRICETKFGFKPYRFVETMNFNLGFPSLSRFTYFIFYDHYWLRGFEIEKNMFYVLFGFLILICFLAIAFKLGFDFNFVIREFSDFAMGRV
jgi:hypothetical protein